MKHPNPYTPGAGFMPAYLAGRENLLEDAEKYLDAIEKRYPQQSVIYFGLRGVGEDSSFECDRRDCRQQEYIIRAY